MHNVKCVRCQQPLPENSGYCVACGCNNEVDRLGKANLALDRREQRASFWRKIASALPFRIFR